MAIRQCILYVYIINLLVHEVKIVLSPKDIWY